MRALLFLCVVAAVYCAPDPSDNTDWGVRICTEICTKGWKASVACPAGQHKKTNECITKSGKMANKANTGTLQLFESYKIAPKSGKYEGDDVKGWGIFAYSDDNCKTLVAQFADDYACPTNTCCNIADKDKGTDYKFEVGIVDYKYLQVGGATRAAVPLLLMTILLAFWQLW
eukprot:NODE_464_length_819_cov_452.432081_g455_i0.p1 GENE.NODE_464_length_819_cov_452.432081_g455_i0~~NODE_464_length_819_cov_452.432081_g455_i0.p1  ORF type:complete len:172 (-),score=47.24 NODE_464_length_819_cov_452.432081_g455_i0:246-761(-)